jgi:hypothetical protein
VFFWYNFAINIPSTVFIVSALKENGLGNVQLNAWGIWAGFPAEFKKRRVYQIIMEIKKELPDQFPRSSLSCR